MALDKQLLARRGKLLVDTIIIAVQEPLARDRRFSVLALPRFCVRHAQCLMIETLMITEL